MHASTTSVFLINLIAAPLINAVVIVYAGCDLTGTIPEAAQRVERIIDRAWAIIVLDAAIAIVQIISYLTIGSGERGDVVLGIVAFFLSTMLIYSETYAALEPAISPWLLVPFALVRSMMLGWVNVWRICLLFALNVTCLVGGFFVQSAPTRYANDLVFAYYSLMAAVLWVLYTVAYVRTVSEERAVFPG